MQAAKKKQVLIADFREAYRKGLCAIFAEEPDGADVVEATTSKELVHLIKEHSFNLIVIHQSLITDIASLPQGNLVILATEPDFQTLSLVRRHGVRAYLQENASSDLLRQLLHFPSGTFFNDSAVSSLVSEYLTNHLLITVDSEILTPREQEVFHLLLLRLSNRAIAHQLHMSEYTLKTHVKHIYESLDLNCRQIRLLSHLIQVDKA